MKLLRSTTKCSVHSTKGSFRQFVRLTLSHATNVVHLKLYTAKTIFLISIFVLFSRKHIIIKTWYIYLEILRLVFR